MAYKNLSTVARVYSGSLTGFDGALLEIETDMRAGLPNLQIVGMGNKAIDEARQRVRSAISNSLLTFPAQKLTVNLAPAELPKDGTHLDLPIALSILVASGQLKQEEVNDTLFAGELALDGSVRPIRGVVLLAELAHRQGLKRIVVPMANTAQAQLVGAIDVVGVPSLQSLYKGLKAGGKFEVIATKSSIEPPVATTSTHSPPLRHPTFDDIIGHEAAKRALTIAAAGRHNILFTGAPGAGKTLLAQSLVSILPPLVGQEIIEVTKLNNLASGDDNRIHTTPPLRAPHHTVTLSALIGGGLRPRPGELSLAHKGILFLDELPEYPRATLEALRQPLEDRTVRLSRLYGHITYPADVQFVATMNPCPCGYLGDSTKQCTCSATQIQSYRKKLSGPLLDRIDLRLSVVKLNHEHFFDTDTLTEKQHPKVLARVAHARSTQVTRYNRSNFYNAYASLEDARKLFNTTALAREFLVTASKKLALTSRGYLRTLRVARTIADLEKSSTLEEVHIAEALQFR